jgi:hypothetical protein
MPDCVPSLQLPHERDNGALQLRSHVPGKLHAAVHTCVPDPAAPVHASLAPGVQPPPEHAPQVMVPLAASQVPICMPVPHDPQARTVGPQLNVHAVGQVQSAAQMCVPVWLAVPQAIESPGVHPVAPRHALHVT